MVASGNLNLELRNSADALQPARKCRRFRIGADQLAAKHDTATSSDVYGISVRRLERLAFNLLVAAAAEAFGGEDYVGFQTAMATFPAFHGESAAYPAIAVADPLGLCRNDPQIQESDGPAKKTLLQLHAAEGATIEIAIRDACRVSEVQRAETLFAPLAAAPLDEAFNALQLVAKIGVAIIEAVHPFFRQLDGHWARDFAVFSVQQDATMISGVVRRN